MTNEPYKITQVANTSNVAANDTIIVIKGANTSSPTVRQIKISQFANTGLGTVFPIYSNNANAVAGGLPVGSIYQTANGELRIVV